MSNLISGKEARLAWANGSDIQLKNNGVHSDWQEDIDNYSCGVFDNKHYVFRLKPKTITLNGIEVDIPRNIVVCAITGSVGLVYGDSEKSNDAADALRKVFNPT